MRDDQLVAPQDGADHPRAGAERLEEPTPHGRIFRDAKLHRFRAAFGERHRRDPAIFEAQFELPGGEAFGRDDVGAPRPQDRCGGRVVGPGDDAVDAGFGGEPDGLEIDVVVVGRGDHRGGALQARAFEHDAAGAVAFDDGNRTDPLSGDEAGGVAVDDRDDPAITDPF